MERDKREKREREREQEKEREGLFWVCGRMKYNHLSFWHFAPVFWSFFAQIEANPTLGLAAFSTVLGLGTPNSPFVLFAPQDGLCYTPKLGRPRNILGCSPTPDPRNSAVDEPRDPETQDLSTEEFLLVRGCRASNNVGDSDEHPRVVLGLAQAYSQTGEKFQSTDGPFSPPLIWPFRVCVF